MRSQDLRWRLGLLLGILLLLGLTACDPVVTETPTPGAVESEAGPGILTRTMIPIVSFTPRFTATPIPSATFTPSITPTPTLTSVPPTLTRTPTLTPTPTIAGVVRSTENVNLRSGPGVQFDIIASVSPGTELPVMGVEKDERDQEWFSVLYFADENSQPQLVWIAASLMETDFLEIVGANATAPPLPEVTIVPTATEVPSRVDILAYCDQRAVVLPRITTDDYVFIEWSWFVASEEYMDEHLANANYNVKLDGETFIGWDEYATEIRREAGRYIIYWYYPAGQLEAGEHQVEYRLTWDEAISDGYGRFGPGTAEEVNEGTCTFTVAEP